MAFTKREARRGRRYDGIVLDPPSYGHGKGGARWELESGIGPLLEVCLAVADPGAFLVLTAHTAGWDGSRLRMAVEATTRTRTARLAAGELELTAASGVALPLGAFVHADLAT